MHLPLAPRTFFPVLALLLTLSSGTVRADDPPRTISTSGEALIQVAPDEAHVGFGVETYHARLDEAKKQNEEASTRLLAAVRALGVEEKDLRTDYLDVSLRYERGEPSRGVDGFHARRAWTLVLHDPAKLEGTIDVVLKNGANRLMGIEFRTSALRKHRDEARRLAIVAAKEKAELLAGVLECKVGRPRTISEEGAFAWSGYRSWWGWGGGGYQQMSQNVMVQGGEGGGGGGGAAEANETLPPGRIGVRARVSVTFDLVP
ncbi:MAG: SIMPL domain-containing protein [Planctomycetes bacterium]|nr:SIMPL domain-containing protein [Planctomycetota bacterium]